MTTSSTLLYAFACRTQDGRSIPPQVTLLLTRGLHGNPAMSVRLQADASKATDRPFYGESPCQHHKSHSILSKSSLESCSLLTSDTS